MNQLLAIASPHLESVVERLGWVLVHSLWQFSLVALLAGVTVRAMRPSSSVLRYGVLVTAMGILVSAPIASWLWIPSDSPLEHSANPVATASAHEKGAANGLETAGAWLARKSPIAGDPPMEGPIRGLAPTSIPSEVLPTAPLRSVGDTPPTLPWSVRAKAMLQPWLAWIVGGWCLGVVLCSARPLLGWHTLRRLKRVGVSPVSDEVLAALGAASEQLGLRGSVQLLQSTLAQVPMVVGYFRPVILLPSSLLTSIPATQLDAILIHELAHIQRHDFIVNLLQTLVETLFFYHPAVWWLSRQIRVEREHCCDDLVVKLLSNRVEYGRALVAIEQLRGQSSVLALGIADGSLLSRVRRIVGFNSTDNVASAVERWPAALFGLALIATTALLTLNWNLSANLADNANGDLPSNLAEVSGDPSGAQLVVKYDMPGAEDETRIYVERMDNEFHLKHGRRDAYGEEEYGGVRFSRLKNGDSLTLSDLPAGEYLVARYRLVDIVHEGTGKAQNSVYLDRQWIEVAEGETKSIDVSRPAGHPISGRVLIPADLNFNTLVVHVCSENATSSGSFSHRDVMHFDALNTDVDGKFTTEPLPPGRYKVLVEGYANHSLSLSGEIVPRWEGSAQVTVTESNVPAASEVTLREFDREAWLKDESHSANSQQHLTESQTVQAIPPLLEFRFAAQQSDSQAEPRVPANYEERDYSGNSAIGRMVAKDKGFIWVPVAESKDRIAALPVERLRGGQVREVLLADTPEHALAWNGKWSVEACRVVADPNKAGGFSIELTLDDAGGKAIRALTKSHLNQPLAILVNNEIIIAPIVLEEFGRDIVITGNFSREHATKLVATLQAGMLNPGTEKNQGSTPSQTETATLIQLDPPPVVGDFSKVDDPDMLLDQLANSPLPSLVPMSGAGYFHHPGAPPQANDVSLWETQYTGDDKLDPRIHRLIELGEVAVRRVHQRLNGLTASDLLATHLTLVLRSVGTKESVPVLIKLMKTTPIAASDGTQSIDEFQKNFQASVTQIAVTSALWKLTGRKHLFTPDQWEKWWQSVKPDFVAPLERTRPEFALRVTPERVESLVGELATNELAARERLIALGPAAVPHLLKVLSLPESLRDPTSPSDVAAIRMAWVIDELGATDTLSAKLRRDYFTHRFSNDDTYAGMYPIDEDALGRVLSYGSFADFCSIYLEADSRGNVPAHMRHIKWPADIYSAYCRRFSKLVARDTGGRTDAPHWKKVVPAENPSDEIASAVPILLAALKDERAERRASASKLADAIGFCTTAKPETLIVALRDAWLAEADEKVRPEIGFAMCRFHTPFVEKEISQGLLSDRPEIVSDCAGLMDWIPIELNDETRSTFDRLVELTRHENDRVRRSATRSLASKAPQLLGPEFERLCTDKVNDIREACTLALRSAPDPTHADILFKLAADAEQTIRESAFSSIANLKHPPSMKRLLPYLRDTKVHGYAVSALASMGGKDAIPLMMSELESGNDVGGMVYQHLRRLTGEDFEDKPEPWLAWWMKNNPAAVSFPNGLPPQASSGTGQGNEKTDPAKQSVEIRLVGGPKAEPLPNVQVEFTTGHGSNRKSFGTFITDDAGLLKASLPVGFYYLHLTSDKELPYLSVEYLWDKESRGPRPDLSLNVTKSGVEKWLAGKKRDEGYEPPAEPNNLPRITYWLLPACELTLRAADADTGEGLPGVEFYEENAVGEDWAHAICGQNIRSKFSWDREPDAASANHTDQDGNFRRLVSANAGFTYGVWKPPAGYEAVTPSEVEIDIRYGQLRAEHIFKFRRIGREARVELEKEKSMLDEPM